MQVKKKGKYIMGKIVSYTVEQLKKLPPIDVSSIPDMIDPDIEMDANHDISDETMNRLIAEKHTLKNKLFKSISIRLNPDTLQKLRSSGKGWQTRLRDAIDKLVKDKVL